jgi:hypothetical protein
VEAVLIILYGIGYARMAVSRWLNLHLDKFPVVQEKLCSSELWKAKASCHSNHDL